jgi:uncharacterized protein
VGQIAITWDEPKRLATIAVRNLDFADLTVDFFAASIVIPAKLGRYQAIGMLGSRAISVIFQPLGAEAIAVISMRHASEKERRVIL